MPSIMHLPSCVSSFDKKKLYQYCKEVVKKQKIRPGPEVVQPEPECSIFVPQDISDEVRPKIIGSRRDMNHPRSGS
jgi:hypothetical protein